MRELRVYKPNKSKGGAGAKFQITTKEKEGKDKKKYKEVMMFLTLAKQGPDNQRGDNSFFWDDKEQSLTVKLSELDAAKMLTVLFGMEKSLGGGKGLFHSPEKASESTTNQGKSQVIHLTKNEDKSGYYLSVSMKQGEKELKIGLGVDSAEGVLLKEFLGLFIKQYYTVV